VALKKNKQINEAVAILEKVLKKYPNFYDG
jgi:hypothetical protein